MDKARFLLSLGDRFGAALAAAMAGEERIAVPLTRDEVEMAIACLDDDTDEGARTVRAIFTRVLRQMSAEDN